MLALELVLLQEPNVALLDEPSAGLSPAAVHDMFMRLQEIVKSTGMTLLLVEQNVEVAKQIADRHLRLEQGTVLTTSGVAATKGDEL
jgi:branched-chain amino acid transport system ATP-binding protein